MNNIIIFCQSKGITKSIEDAFFAYCRSTYARKYELRNGETMKLVVTKMTRDEVEDAWQEFVKDMRVFLTSK